MASARRVHSLLKLTSYFNFEVGGVHTISSIAEVTQQSCSLHISR